MRSPWLGLFARRLAREVFLHIAIALAAAITLFIAIDSVEAANRALTNATLADMLELELFNLPAVVQQFATIAVLIGTTTAIGALVRRGEVVAMFASGASPAAILRPALLVGLAIAVLEAAMTEWIVPPARAEVSAARRRLGLPESSTSSLAGASKTWFRGEDLVYRVEELEDPQGRALGGVLMLRLANGRLLDRWDCARLIYESGEWIGEEIVHRRFAPDGSLATERKPRAEIALPEAPEDFVRSIGAPDRLPYRQLEETARARERLGQPSIAHRLELYRRLAYPATLMIAAVLAAAVALRLGRRPTIAASLGMGAVFGFALWIFDELGLALGSTSALPPLAAAHLSAILAAALALGAWSIVLRRGLRP